MHESFLAYCAAVCRQIRYPFVRKSVAAELAAHLEDRAEALTQRGTDPDESARLAVAAMGDPVETGKALNRLYPPFWHWLTRLMTLAVLCLVAILISTAVGYTMEGDWSLVDLATPGGPTAQQALEDTLQEGERWNQRVLARGRVTGGGRLGDYTFTAESEVRLVDSPAFLWDGVSMGGYRQLQFVLTAKHWQPWLPSLIPEWAAPTLTDGSGEAFGAFDQERRLQISSWRQSPFTDYIYVYLTDPDPAQTSFAFTLTGPDGRVLTFDAELTQWEETP